MTKKNIAKIVCVLAAAVVSLASCSSELTDLQNLKAGTYTVAYSANTTDTVTGSMPTQTVTRGTTTALTVNTFVRSGYVFAGWMTAADGTDAVYTDAQEVTDIAAAGAGMTLYALWSNTVYSVAFKANDTHATGTMGSQVISPGVATKLTANAFAYTGYLFKGWATSTNGLVAYADGASVTDLATAGTSVTLYAVWSVSNVSSPADVQGTAALLVIKARITDHLYLASSAAGTGGYIACLEVTGASAYQWWTRTDGTSWSEVSGQTTQSLNFTAAAGTVYYCLAATNGDSTAYSNVCTVECGTSTTDKIGMIYYTDGNVSSSYESGKTPAGIVCDVKPDGSVKTIVALEQSSTTLAWAPSDTTGYTTTFATSLADGKGNWAVIQAEDPTGSANAATKYPAFSYCNAYTGGGYEAGTWYLPSRDELSTICFNKTSINAGLNTLTDGGYSETATQLGTDSYWSSSQYSSSYFLAWIVYYSNVLQQNHGKNVSSLVRCVTSF